MEERLLATVDLLGRIRTSLKKQEMGWRHYERGAGQPALARKKKNYYVKKFFHKNLVLVSLQLSTYNQEQGITLYIPESCNVDLVVLEVLQVKTFHIKRGESIVVLKINK
jgi:hypothetical protein